MTEVFSIKNLIVQKNEENALRTKYFLKKNIKTIYRGTALYATHCGKSIFEENALRTMSCDIALKRA